jgi:hypothetical protein
MKYSFIVAAFIVVARIAHAENGMDLAQQLASILAAEQPCQLSYNREAIQRYIAAKVAASDMAFPGLLQLFVQGEAVEIGEISPATVVAFCAQAARVAKFNGFIQ